MRRAAPDADRAGLLLPLQDAVVRDVAPQQIAAIAEPHRPLGEAAAAGDALDRGIAEHVFLKARVEHLDVGIGIADRRRPFLPASVCHLRFPSLNLAPAAHFGSGRDRLLRQRRASQQSPQSRNRSKAAPSLPVPSP